jgi:DNA replication protein DnaC
MIRTDTSGADTSISTTEPSCPICGGAGFFQYQVPTEDPRFGEVVPCSCTLERERVRRHERLMERSSIGPLRLKTFAAFGVVQRPGAEPGKSPKAALIAAKEFAARPDRSEIERLQAPEKEWLILTGGHGTGKTHLAAAIANYRLDANRPAVFMVVPDLLDRLRATFAPNSDISYDELFDTARTTELLILDDLGAQSSTQWAQEKLYQIVNERYNRRLPTVITTNLSLDDMELRMRSRLGDTKLADLYLIVAGDIRTGTSPQSQEIGMPVARATRTRRH